jgi:hypothetical protein
LHKSSSALRLTKIATLFRSSGSAPLLLDLGKIILGGSEIFAFLHSLGHHQTFRDVRVTSASPRQADIDRQLLHVGVGPICDISHRRKQQAFGAKLPAIGALINEM